MDVPLKGLSLLWTQVSSAARILLALPLAIARCLWLGIAPASLTAPQDPGSCVFYEGVVTHARKRPVSNAFEYRVRTALVDLDAPPAWFSSHQARDHMTADEARAFAGTDGKVLLLTNPVSAGYVQNPISVYYCYPAEGSAAEDSAAAAGPLAGSPASRTRSRLRRQQQQQDGDGPQQQNGKGGQKQQQQQRVGAAAAPEEGPPPVRAIAEVTNTPWGDRVRFAFKPNGDISPKALHVSPFMDMDNAWHVKATPPGPRLRLSVVVTHPTLGQYFDAHLVAERCSGAGASALNEHAGLWRLIRYGFMPQRVAFWIYAQAVILIAKGCPIYLKPPGEAFKGRVAEAADGKLPAVGGGSGGCPYQWTDTTVWPWNL